MAHFAKIDRWNTVVEVIVVNNDVITVDGVEDEQVGIDFCKSLYGQDTIWKQTSYSGSFRGCYAGIGYTYDWDNDVFVPPKEPEDEESTIENITPLQE